MVVNTLLPHLSVLVTVDDAALEEYEDESTPESERTVTRFIESETEKTFAVLLKVDNDFAFVGNGLEIYVFVDGNLADALMVRQEDVVGSIQGYTCCSDGLHNAADEVRKYTFSNLQTVVSDASLHQEQALVLRGLGCIRVEVSHCMTGDVAEFEAPESNVVGDEVSEKDTKGQQISNSVSFAEAKKSAAFDYFNAHSLADQPSPFAIYRFNYRSLDDLKTIGLIERTPSPPPLERREAGTLTLEEIQELQRRVNTAEEDNMRIKQEYGDGHRHRRRKAVPRAGDEQLEMSEDGEVRPNGTPMPVFEPVVVVLDDD